MELDILVEDPRWDDAALEVLARNAFSAVFARLDLPPGDAEISLLGCGDARISALNAEFRGKPAPTNVLSWPAEDLSAATPGAEPRAPRPDPDGAITLGDIAISFDTCEAEAAAQGKSFDDHVTHLLVHGLLHLLGYDHLRDPDATLMEHLETEILGRLGIDDPYRELDGAGRPRFG